MLVESRIGTKDCEIIDLRVSGQTAKTRNDRVISNLGIVANMGPVHDVVVVTDSRTASATRCTDMDGDLLSNLSSSTDFETR